MRMRKVLSGLLVLLLAMTLLTVPVIASPDDNGAVEQEPLAGITEPEPEVDVTDSVVEATEPGVETTQPGTETVEPEQGTETVEPEQGTGGAEALTPEGNMTLVDNIGNGDKQFIVVQSRNGYYFYIIIDHASEGDNTVHFLNQVDEADLLALIEGEVSAPPVPVCTCTAKCTVGAVNTSCEVCAVNMGECVGAMPDPEPGPETTEKPDTPTETDPPEGTAGAGGVNPLMIVVVLAVLGAGGAVAYLKFFRKKPKAKPNLEDYDFGDDDTDDADEPEDDDPDEDDPDEETEDE